MIPQITEYPVTEPAEQPTRTYAVDFESGRAAGMTDGLAAMKQAIFLILNTERFRHLIYSWNYGHELKAVFGSDTELAKSEVRRLVTEALLQDERIASVEDFSFSSPARGELAVNFTARTIFGEVDFGVEVKL